MIDTDGKNAARHEHFKQLLLGKIRSLDDFRNVWNGTHKGYFYHLPNDVEISFISPAAVKNSAYLCLGLTVPSGVDVHIDSFQFEIFDAVKGQFRKFEACSREINLYGAGSKDNNDLPVTTSDYSNEEITLRISRLSDLPAAFVLFLPAITVNEHLCRLDPIAFISDKDKGGLKIARCTGQASDGETFL